MKKLGIMEQPIKEFEEQGKVNLSEGPGLLYWLNDEEQEMVRKFEEDSNGLVYHVIKTQMNFGLMYSFLYVSEHIEEWQMDMEDFLETVRRYTHVTKITRRMVSELIDHIDVYHAEKQDGVTNQRVVIYYNCIGAFDVPDRRKIPEADIIMETRKGVALSYAPEQVAV